MAKRGKRMTIALTREETIAPTPEQLAQGGYARRFVMHAESATETMAYRRQDILERWFAQGWPGFDEPARLAINWCHKCWEARGVIGNLSANYEPTIGGASSQYARDVELMDELDEVRAWFHPTHWAVFENVVRWGHPAGAAGSSLADNTSQAISAARATVGLVANFIAAKRGY